MFVEGAYPVFLERGRGSRVWDVDGNEYVDYILGLASITLGYAYPAITEAVARQLERGSIFSLPHPLEVEVSERLAEIIPCAEMARFVEDGLGGRRRGGARGPRRDGARRRAVLRAITGWHDWYAITTPRSKGIPKDFARLVAPFEYNDLASLEARARRAPRARGRGDHGARAARRARPRASSTASRRPRTGTARS